jgi:hypothetical protein
MNWTLFKKIVLVIREFNAYFLCKQECVGTIGFFSIQKCTSGLSMLAYEALGDTQYFYMCLTESEREHRVHDNELYHRQGPLANVDH